MKEYMKYADDYLLFKLEEYKSQLKDFYNAREMIPNNSILAYLSITATIKHIEKKKEAVLQVLTHRGYNAKDLS